MQLLTPSIRARLIGNARLRLTCAEQGKPEPDFIPVVKLFTPDAACTWLLTELDPDDPDITFGLCDLGLGFPELGSISLSEIRQTRGQFGLPVERDRYFCPRHPLSVYARAARKAGIITEDDQALAEAAAGEGAP